MNLEHIFRNDLNVLSAKVRKLENLCCEASSPLKASSLREQIREFRKFRLVCSKSYHKYYVEEQDEEKLEENDLFYNESMLKAIDVFAEAEENLDELNTRANKDESESDKIADVKPLKDKAFNLHSKGYLEKETCIEKEASDDSQENEKETDVKSISKERFEIGKVYEDLDIELDHVFYDTKNSMNAIS